MNISQSMLEFIKKKMTEKAANYIKKEESLQLTVYTCPAGQLTIGWGHALRIGEEYTTITEEFAEKLFQKDIKHVEFIVNRLVLVKLTQSQFDALCCLVFNWGSGNFARSKGLKELNKGNYAQARWEFFEDPLLRSIKGSPSVALSRRRDTELEMWDRFLQDDMIKNLEMRMRE